MGDKGGRMEFRRNRDSTRDKGQKIISIRKVFKKKFIERKKTFYP